MLDNKLFLIVVYICRMFLYLAIGASYFGKWYWVCDILASFRLYFIFGSFIILIISLALRHRTPCIIVATLLFLQIYDASFSYLRRPANIPSNDVAESISILQYNVHYLNKNHVKIVDYLIENQAQTDVIFLQEVPSELKHELKRLDSYYPYQIIKPSDKWLGRALLSKLPIIDYHIKHFADTPIHYLIATLKTKDQSIPINFYGIHTTAPFSGAHVKYRNSELEIIANELVQDPSQHKILIGDFNTTSFSYWFKKLESTTKMISAERSTGINNTWPSWLPFNLLRISIDHALVTSNIEVVKRSIGQNLGSDHLPVILDLRVYK